MLIGLLAGPGVVLAGTAVCGSLGGSFRWSVDVAFDDLTLYEFATDLDRDTLALVVVGEGFGSAMEEDAVGGKGDRSEVRCTRIEEKHRKTDSCVEKQGAGVSH